MVLDVYQNSLYDLLKTRKHLTERQVRIVAIQLLGGLKLLRRKHVVHCDLKLENILIDAELNVGIGDFGLAAMLSPGERIYTERGTLDYKAPESFDAPIHGYDADIDIWSLGVIL